MAKELIRLTNLTMEFDGETILDNINLYINDHEFLTLLGPSGCGKTTTLRIIGGFLTPTSGDVFFDGQKINDVPSYKRKINTVFQRYALFPHLDVYDNIAFGLRIAKLPELEIDQRVEDMLDIVSLRGFENRKVTQLSGGKRLILSVNQCGGLIALFADARQNTPAVLCRQFSAFLAGIGIICGKLLHGSSSLSGLAADDDAASLPFQLQKAAHRVSVRRTVFCFV